MKFLRLTTVTSMAVFYLLAPQDQLMAQEPQEHSVASLINDSDEIAGFSETSTPNPMVATTVKLYPTHLSFGSVRVDVTSSPKTVTLTNLGTSSLSIYGIAITGTDRGDFFQTHTCGTKLARGASCSIKVTFRPTVSGTRTAALSIRDNGAGSPQMVPLDGTGVRFFAGVCSASSNNKLTGGCISNAIGGLCLGSSGGTACPVGSVAIKPGQVFCRQFLRDVPVDGARHCSVVR
jgi:Abnormal spindle-like microcephaly-assoc'd, ASPM-SPD-2-Hydin